MKLVVIESPYAGEVAENVKYAKRCFHDCFKRGEAPYASHLLFTQEGILDDAEPEQRKLGIAAGLLWSAAAPTVAVYVDRGISSGMAEAIKHHVTGQRSGPFPWPTVLLRSLLTPLEVAIDYMSIDVRDRPDYALVQAEAYAKMISLVRAAT